jgi:vanillate monooxygenase ferredoxin subunit
MSAELRQMRVAHRVEQAEAICALQLEPVDGKPLQPFSAGSHIDVHLDQNLVRQYSLCSLLDERNRYEIAVLRDPRSRGGSRAVHEHIREGDTLSISKPRNHFALVENAKRSVLLAGGIGVTPLLCMMEQLEKKGASYDLHYCVRSRGQAAFVARLNEPRLADRVHIHVDDEDAAQRMNVTKALGSADEDSHVYICGPHGFIEWVMQCAQAGGWDSHHLHCERFGAVSANEISAQLNSGDRSFEVMLARSGRVIHVAARQSAAQALRDAGVDVPLSCEQGVCGTCLTGVLEGEVEHRDMLLSDSEKQRHDLFTPCCSRAKSGRLVIDL